MSKSKKNNLDWKEQLLQIKKDMEANMTEEEKARQRKEEVEKRKRYSEFAERKKMLYDFLAGYKQNSGIFINNFFRKRDYKTYCDDKFHAFDFDISGILPNVFDDFEFSMKMVSYLSELEKNHIAYFPITEEYITHLTNFARVLDILDPLYSNAVLYRGCSTLERNGVNGIVSTTSDRKIAEQFSRGTILILHVPKGTKCLRVKSIRPKEQRRKDYENEILLPPCDYEILSKKVVKSGNEPNNHKGSTNIIELQLKPLNILEEFLEVMENPPHEYNYILKEQQDSYNVAKMMLETYIKENG